MPLETAQDLRVWLEMVSRATTLDEALRYAADAKDLLDRTVGA